MSKTESPNINIYNFQHKLCDTMVNYQVTKMQGQNMIWIGSGDPTLSNISGAVPCPPDYPATTLIGSSDQSIMLASRLAKKLNKQVGFKIECLKVKSLLCF